MYVSTDSLPDEFSGSRALVTGGSRGIGAAVSHGSSTAAPAS